jgi:hypothetical protein
MENINLNEYVLSKDLQSSFSSKHMMLKFMDKYKVEMVQVKHLNYYNREQTEKVLQELEYRKSIAVPPTYHRKDRAYEVPVEIQEKSYTANQIAIKYYISKVHAIRLLHMSKAPYVVGNYKRHWYPKEWIDLNFEKVLDDARKRDKRRNLTLQNNQAT